MPYANGENPKVGDGISDDKGRLGSVATVYESEVFTARWDECVVDINYSVPE